MRPTIPIAWARLSLLTWTVAGVHAARSAYPANPTLVRDAVYVSSQGLTRFQRGALEPQWRVVFGIQTLEPVVTRKTVLVGTTRGLCALDPTTGAKRWRIASGKTLFPPAVSDSMVYVGGRDGSLRAIALDTGWTIWRRDFRGWIYTPAIVDGRLAAGGSEGILRGIDARNGDQLWQKTLEQEVVYRPVAVPGGGVVITTFGAKIVMVNASTGGTRREVRDITPSFPPAVHAGRLYFGTFAGSLKA
ncbi:MAG: PQQ-binding-like beta-propeller repeat protein [Acidiferrobacterales bacterium]